MCENSNRTPVDNSDEEATCSYVNCFCTLFTPIFPPTVKPITDQRIDKSHWITHYADTIFQTLRETEGKRRLIGFRSQQCGYRLILLRFLKTATENHKLARTTLHLGVYLLDCFMDSYTIRADRLNLTAITCLIIAAKIEEAEMDMPKFAELNKLVGAIYTLNEFKNVEFRVLKTTKFELIRPTAATFAEYFANSFITLNDYHTYLHNWHNGALNYQPHMTLEQQMLLPLYTSYEEMLNSLSKLLFELVDVTLNYLKFTNARPSMLAAACIAAVRQMQNISPTWTPYLVKLTECTEDLIAPFVEAIIALHNLHTNKKRLQYAQLQSSLDYNHATALPTNVLSYSPDSGIISADARSESDDESADEIQDNQDDNLNNVNNRINTDNEMNMGHINADDVTDDTVYKSFEYTHTKRRRLF